MPRIRPILQIARLATRPRVLWPVLVVAALLSVPAECARIGHPHSLFQSPVAAASATDRGSPHTASDHAPGSSQTLPAWASPLGIPTLLAAHGHPGSDGAIARSFPIARHLGPAAVPAPAARDLPVLEPMVPAVLVAFGSPVALLLGLVVLVGMGRGQIMAAAGRLVAPLVRGSEPPPPRPDPPTI